MTYFTLNGIELIVLTKGMNVDPQIRVSSVETVGANGSITNSLGRRGTKLNFKVYVTGDDVKEIESLMYDETPVPFVSQSKADLNGIYRITDFKFIEEDIDIFEFSIELQEHTEWVVKTKNFENWKVDKAKALPNCPKAGVPVKDSKGKVTIPNPNANIPNMGSKVGTVVSLKEFNKTNAKITPTPGCVENTASKASQLKDCPTLKENNKNKECNKTLQRALKENNEYISYNGHNLIVDGDFGFYTKDSVKKFQKKKKLVIDGVVGPKTKAAL